MILRRLRDTGNTNVPFCISSSGHLCHSFNRKILNVALLRLRFCSIRHDKSDLNLSAKHCTLVFPVSLSFIPYLILLLFSGLNIFSQEIQHDAAPPSSTASSGEASEEQKADDAVMGPLPLDVDRIVGAMGGMCSTALSEKASEISGEQTAD